MTDLYGKENIFYTLLSDQLIMPFLCSRTKAEIDEFASVTLKDISIVKTLGVGGFGRVELVSLTLNTKLIKYVMLTV